MTEDERWTVPSENIIPGKSVFTIKREGTKKVRIVGCGNFQEDTGIAVFCCECERDNCQSGHVDCRYAWMVLDRNRCENCFSARISGRTGGYLRKTSTSAVSVGFHSKGCFVEAQEGSLWTSFSSEALRSHKRRCSRCFGDVS